MICIQVFLPLLNGRDASRHARMIKNVKQELIEQFGGVTAFVNTPAEGAWRKHRRTVNDRIVVIEVMTKRVNRAWWARYKRDLEKRLTQEEIVIRAIQVELL